MVRTSYDIPINEKIPTEKWKGMMTVSGTVLLTYFATEIGEISKGGEYYRVSLRFLHKCMAELKALIQGSRVQ